MSKIIINVNGEDVEITLTTEQLASIEEQKKPKKFKFKYDSKIVYVLGEHYYNVYGYPSINQTYVNHGRYRLTEEVAKQSLDRNRRANRLEALADQLGGLLDWGVCERRYHVTLLHSTYEVHSHGNLRHIAEVYMTEECAKEICRMLNVGEFEL